MLGEPNFLLIFEEIGNIRFVSYIMLALENANGQITLCEILWGWESGVLSLLVAIEKVQ